MKPADLRKLSDAELDARVREMRDQVFDLRIKLATQQLEKNATIRQAKRDLARALTVRAEREKKS